MSHNLFRISLVVLLLSACAPSPHDTSNSSSSPVATNAGRLQGVWLKKSVADNFRSGSAPECGTLVTFSPTAFEVEPDGNMKLIVLGGVGDPLTLGQVGGHGNVRTAGLFERLDLEQDLLRTQNTVEQKAVEYVRSSRGEVEKALLQSDDCTAELNQDPTTALGIENRAILAKNKIQLAVRRSAGFDLGDLALSSLLTGSGVLWGREFLNLTSAQAKSAVAAKSFELSTLNGKQSFETSVREIETDFKSLKEQIMKRLPQDAHLSGMPMGADHRSLRDQLDLFNGNYDVRVKLEPGAQAFGRPFEQGPNGEKYIIQPGGKIQLTPQESSWLASLREQHQRAENEGHLSGVQLEKQMKLAKQNMRRTRLLRNTYGSAMALFATAEIAHLWYNSRQSSLDVANRETVAQLIELNDEDLRAKIRLNPKIATLLIQAEKSLRSY